MLSEETREIAVVAVAKFVGELDQGSVRGAEQASRDGYPAAIQIMLRRSTHAAPELLKKSRAGQSHTPRDVIDLRVLHGVLVDVQEGFADAVVDRSCGRDDVAVH